MKILIMSFVGLFAIVNFASCDANIQLNSNNSKSSSDKVEDIFYKNNYEIFNLGADIYICRIIETIPKPESSDNLFNRGIVKLEIVNTICGNKKKEITLPYVFAKGFIKHATYMPKWPDIMKNKGALLLCVVCQKGYDSQAVKDPNSVDIKNYFGAASQINIISNEKDAKVEEIKYICELYKKNDKKLYEEALKDKREKISTFAKEALANYKENSTAPEK